MSEISVVFTCECRPDFNWKNKHTYKNHKKSIRHQNYEKINQEKEHRKNITKLQIEYDKLKRDMTQLKELYINCAKENMELKNRLNII